MIEKEIAQDVEEVSKKKWYKKLFKKELLKKKWFWIAMVVSLFFVSIVFGQVKKATQGVEYETVKVERGTVTQTVDATGNIESANELDLRFETSGRVGWIYKKNGEQVKVGDLIVDLQLGELNSRVAQASASVSRYKANLDKVLAGETSTYISNLKAKLDQANANLDKMKASSNNAVQNAQAALDTAEYNLELSEGGADSQIVNDAYSDMVALLNSIQNTLSESLTQADNILGVDNSLANDDFESVLSVIESSKIYTAESKYQIAKSAKNIADEKINLLSISSAEDDILVAANFVEEAILSAKSLLFAVSEVLDNTRPIGSLTQSELSTLKTGIQTVRASVSTNYVSLVNQLQAVETAKNSYGTNQVAYEKAKVNLENTIAQSSADVHVYEALVAQSQANYDEAKNPAREEDVAASRAQLWEAQASLGQAVASRNKARIIAPIEGVIGKIDARVGEYISSQDAVVKLVSPHYEVKVDIPETDIIKIFQGGEALITLDAFGDDIRFKAMVTEIEIGETIIQDVVYYSVTLTLEEDGEHEILNGMTANVLFYTQEKEGVLYVPIRTVKSSDEGKYVRVVDDGKAHEVIVKTGLRGDGGLIEILEGLSEGQDVVMSEIEQK